MTVGLEVKKAIPAQLDLGNLTCLDVNALDQSIVSLYIRPVRGMSMLLTG